jgi:hypothetical protein
MRAVETGTQHQGQLKVVVHAEGVVQRRRLRHVAQVRQRSGTVMPRIHSGNRHAPAGRPLEADPGLDQRRFAGRVRADQRGDPAARDGQVDPLQGPGPPSVALGQASGLQHGH